MDFALHIHKEVNNIFSLILKIEVSQYKIKCYILNQKDTHYLFFLNAILMLFLYFFLQNTCEWKKKKKRKKIKRIKQKGNLQQVVL